MAKRPTPALPAHRIETRKVADLVPAEYNPRKIDPKALAGLKASVERFGAVQPIIVNDRTGRIVGGHQRLKALQQLGQTETTVIVVDLPEIEEKALNVALNNPATSGEFDDGLAALLEEIQTADSVMFADLRLDLLIEPVRPAGGEESSTEEIDVDAFALECKCPRCGFEFNRE